MTERNRGAQPFRSMSGKRKYPEFRSQNPE
jgi:hypothetical protein